MARPGGAGLRRVVTGEAAQRRRNARPRQPQPQVPGRTAQPRVEPGIDTGRPGPYGCGAPQAGNAT
eukprot:3461168-Lingulodinium_polyedra.AAC.1